MTKFFALALLAGAMVSCSTEDTAPFTQNDKVAVQFPGSSRQSAWHLHPRPGSAPPVQRQFR